MQGRPLVMLLAVLYGSAFLAGFNENLVNMALMSIMDEYAVDSVTAQWLVTGYMIVATVVVTCMAFLYRRVPLRTLFFAASALSLAGSLMGLFAASFAWLMAARLIQAVGTGIFIPLMMNTILAVAPKNRLGSYMSVGGCMITFGPALAPVVCGALVTAFGWHSIFAVPAIAMAALAVLGVFFVKNLDNSDAHLDIPSVVLSAAGLTALSFGLAELTLAPVPAACALLLAALLIAAFIVRQLRCEHPLIDLTPVRSIAFWPALVLVTVAMMSTFSLSVLLPLYFEGATGLSALLSGLLILVPVLLNAGTTLVGGRIMDKRGEWPLLPAGFAMIAVGFAVLALMAPSLSLPAMFAGMLLTYAGVGFIFSPSQTAGLRTLPPAHNPFGVALMTTFVQIAACIGPSMYTGIMSSTQTAAGLAGAAPAQAAAEGFSCAVTVAALIGALGCAVAFAYARAAIRRSADARAGASESGLRAGGMQAIMQPDPYTLPAAAPVSAAMRELIDRKVSGMPLVDAEGRAVGFVSDGDIMRYLADKHPMVLGPASLAALANSTSFDERLRELMGLPVSAIATERLVALDATADFEQACELLAKHKLKKVPVLRDGRIVGMVSRSNVIRYAMESALDEMGGTSR